MVSTDSEKKALIARFMAQKCLFSTTDCIFMGMATVLNEYKNMEYVQYILLTAT